jgi:monoamine oxidase
MDQPALSSVMLRGCFHPFRGGSAGAYFDELGGLPGIDRWTDLAGSVLDQLAVAQRTGCWSDHLVALRRMAFPAFVARAALPRCLEEWIRVVVESETAVEWEHLGALDGIAEMSTFPVQRNLRVAGGNDGVIAALAERLPADTIRLGALVREVRGGGRSVVYEDASARRHVEHGHHVVVTSPLWSLGAIDVEPALDRRARAAVVSGAAGSYVKVVLRLRADRLDMERLEHLFPLLTDGPAGCVYFAPGGPCGGDHTLTMLIHGRHARALTGRPRAEIVARSVEALACLTDGRTGQPLLAGVGAAVAAGLVFDHRHAVAFWPNERGRSRYDELADALRAPHGRLLIGGDSTDSSHSDGAVRAGQRMAAHILERVGFAEAAACA